MIFLKFLIIEFLKAFSIVSINLLFDETSLPAVFDYDVVVIGGRLNLVLNHIIYILDSLEFTDGNRLRLTRSVFYLEIDVWFFAQI